MTLSPPNDQNHMRIMYDISMQIDLVKNFHSMTPTMEDLLRSKTELKVMTSIEYFALLETMFIQAMFIQHRIKCHKTECKTVDFIDLCEIIHLIGVSKQTVLRVFYNTLEILATILKPVFFFGHQGMKLKLICLYMFP